MSRLPQLQKLLAATPDDPDVLYMLAQEHAKLADYPAAIAAYDRCLALDPRQHYAFFHKARAQESAGDPLAAAATLTTGLAAAQKAGNTKAASEIAGYLDSLRNAD